MVHDTSVTHSADGFSKFPSDAKYMMAYNPPHVSHKQTMSNLHLSVLS